MNDSKLESSLRALHPLAPPAALEERIAADLAAPSPIASPTTLTKAATKERGPVSIRFEQAPESLWIRFFHNLGWAVAGAASAVAAIALYPAKLAPERPASPAVQMSQASAANAVRAASAAPAANKGAPTSPGSGGLVAASLPITSAEAADFQAVETTRELISTQEEGELLYRNGSGPMRQVRNLYRERRSWTNPRTGARVEIEIPREDVFLKPVSLQ